MAAVVAKSPWAATLGDSNAALAPTPGKFFQRRGQRWPEVHFLQ
jgi:hypothetical protein